jgi:hypothetical protein
LLDGLVDVGAREAIGVGPTVANAEEATTRMN